MPILATNKSSNLKTMAIKLIANIEHHKDAGYVASIDSIKGMVVSANSFDQVVNELFISLKVKLAHSLGISASEIQSSIQEVSEQDVLAMERQVLMKNSHSAARAKAPGSESSSVCKKEINLTLSA